MRRDGRAAAAEASSRGNDFLDLAEGEDQHAEVVAVRRWRSIAWPPVQVAGMRGDVQSVGEEADRGSGS